AKEKALIMKPLQREIEQQKYWDFIVKNVTYKDNLINKFTVKGSQFCQPLFEFSGACAGCGETPYIKLITQLFGDRMMIANATGCSSIYGGSAPATPYCINAEGRGPAWASSLFEDASEYGYGMYLGVTQQQNTIAQLLEQVAKTTSNTQLKAASLEWLAGRNNAKASREATQKLLPLLKGDSSLEASEVLKLAQYLEKKSIWIFGGDGFAYDIGFGGLDHVIASGEDVNILVLDTEVYSNTGGQSSKATPIAAQAKFATSGKRVRKKDLGMMAITYGYVYVAQVAMGASQMQYMRAITEAENYPGPSVIIAYAPCINHGLREGMGKSQLEEKKAVECGYWSMWRYNPLLEKEGKNPFILDSKEPNWDKFKDFLMGEVRYSALKKEFPEVAEDLFNAALDSAKWRYNNYKRLASN
ncbi:MAG TPA: thiamine pyrophosphate-dependent enzyme, partial [Spirochaetota bacterium]|nr:thiamine pyrophosphate-dependent enzyme [Spirochaetota bacterium]